MKPKRVKKPAIPTLNVRLLRKVQKHILAVPRRLRMFTWQMKVSKRTAPCGTVACIAGWTVILSGHKIDQFTISDKARDLLGLGYEEGRVLFYSDRWPDEFQDKYIEDGGIVSRKGYSNEELTKLTLKQIKSNAQITSNRIDHFIATGE